MENIEFKVLAIFFIAFFISCNTSKNPLFGKRTPREKYADNIREAGLQNTELGKLWMSAGEKSLKQPLSVSLPFKETGYFPADRPSAAGYKFSVQQGENVLINITTVPSSGVLYFSELWQMKEGQPSLLNTLDTLNNSLEYTVKKDAQYLFRIQPELLKTLEYTVTISTGPSLAFPVDSSGAPTFISYWGANRDAGARSHEGIDIKANFRTPAFAGADGIARAGNNDLGGKVVFVYDASTGNSLYYAHLDSQVVYTGEPVSRGEVVGLIGKTGNAKNTVPHLHFGIYTGSGAINPFPFINPNVSVPAPITASTQKLNKWLRTVSPANIYEGPSEKSAQQRSAETGEAIFVLGASANFYRIVLPGGIEGYVRESLLTDNKLRSETIMDTTRLLDSASLTAPAKAIITKGSSVEVIGKFNNFYLVSDGDLTGWIAR